MGTKTNYLRNKLVDAFWRAQAFTMPANHYFALLTSTKGPRANSTAYALNDTFSVVANDGKSHLYKVTTAGTSAAAQSTLYPGVALEVITDGSVVATEQDAALRAGTAVEVSGGSYARVGVASSLANFAGTQGAGTTVASSGTTGQTSNNGAITWPAPTANWGFVWGVATFDASSAGNPLEYGGLTLPKTINSGDAAPTYPIAAFVAVEDV